MIKLQVCVVIKLGSKLHCKFTVQALGDERQVTILADLTLDECANLQGDRFSFIYIFIYIIKCKLNLC